MSGRSHNKKKQARRAARQRLRTRSPHPQGRPDDAAPAPDEAPDGAPPTQPPAPRRDPRLLRPALPAAPAAPQQPLEGELTDANGLDATPHGSERDEMPMPLRLVTAQELYVGDTPFPDEILLGHAAPFFDTVRDAVRRLDYRLTPRVHAVLEDTVDESFVHVDNRRSQPEVERIAQPLRLLELMALPLRWQGSLHETLTAANLDSDNQSWLFASSSLYEGHTLYVILRLPRSPGWQRRSLEHNQAHGFPVSRSILESLCEVFVDELVNSIETIAAPVRTRRPDERVLLKIAAGRFIASLATRCFGSRPEAHLQLFDAIDDVSTLPYERRHPTGGLVLAANGHPHVKHLLHLSEPVDLHDSRRLRKVLELSSGPTMHVLIDSSSARGLARVRESYDGESEDCFNIVLSGHHQWQIRHGEQRLLEVRAGDPILRSTNVTRSELKDALLEAFGLLDEPHVELLWRTVRSASEQVHGTMLVIHAHAEREAERLTLESFRIAPSLLSDELIEAVTSIDGAVLLTPQARCVAIGVIVDGVASGAADRTRGARYNSAVRYVTAQRGLAVAIVVSEDGTVDLVRYDPRRGIATR